jgi:Flp pilus assembly protein TadG
MRPQEACRRRRLLADTTGATALMLAIGIVPVTGAVGLAIDASMGYILKSRLSRSLDAAGLAAGRVALNDNAEEIARQYFDANFGENLGRSSITDFALELDESRQFVTLTASAARPTVFMRVFGYDELSVAARAVIQRETTGIELALVLDNTGSMHGTPFATMQAAAYDLIDIIFGDEVEVENLWVSLVPYTAVVNIGPTRTTWLAASDRVRTQATPYFPDTQGWKGCVMARAHPHDTDDTPPATAPFTSFFYGATASTLDNNWPPVRAAITHRNDGRGPNLGCGPAITPLTASRAVIDAAIGNMGAWHRGGTAGNIGLSWGWRTISPRWRGLWGGDTPATHPLDYDEPFMEKVVVVLTDGNNQFYDHDTSNNPPRSDFTAYGRLEALGVTTLAQGRTLLDQRMAQTCTAMKAQGIRIYSIIFGGAPDAQARTLFQNCATTPAMYYYAPTNAQLAGVFRAIGGQLANLKIVE